MIGGPRNFALRLLLIAAFLLVWEGIVRLFQIPMFILPTPTNVFIAFYRGFESSLYIDHIWITVGETLIGFVLGTALAFLLGTAIATVMMRFRAVDRFLAPILGFFQGIPALSWVVFAIIWFHGTEPRIFFIMTMTALPAFTFQVLDSLRGMSNDLVEMVMSFRPTRRKMFRAMILPAILPDILTAWKVNLGNASRVVVVAELVGATGGVGYELLQQQQIFDMAGALAWTLQLVFFVLISQKIIALIESYAFRYRAVSERSL